MPPTTETAPSRRLTWEQVRWARRVYATGQVTMETIAALLGVRVCTVWKLIHRDTWRGE